MVAPVFPFAPGAAPDNALLGELGLPFKDEIYLQGLQETYRANALKNEARAFAQIKKEGLDHEPKTGFERTLKWQIGFAASNMFYIDRWRQMRGGQSFYSPAVLRKVPQECWRFAFEPAFARQVPAHTVRDLLSQVRQLRGRGRTGPAQARLVRPGGHRLVHAVEPQHVKVDITTIRRQVA